MSEISAVIKDKDKEQKIQNTKELLLVTLSYFYYPVLLKVFTLHQLKLVSFFYSLLPLLTTVSVIVQQPVIKLAILDQLTE